MKLARHTVLYLALLACGQPAQPLGFSQPSSPGISKCNVSADFTGDCRASTPLALASSLTSLSYGEFGDGFDGSPTFDGSTTVLGLAPSASTYTLVRDIYLDSPVFNAGVTIKTAGFRVFVKTNLIGPASGLAVICDPGNPGANAASSSGGAGGTVRTLGTAIFDPGTSGASGIAGTGFGVSGAGHTSASPGYLAGTGGVGGTPNAGGAGGGGGTQGAPVAWSAFNGSINNILQALNGMSLTGGGATRFRGGTGGSTGGVSGTTDASGGAGAGGGIVVVAAKLVTNPANVIIHADGGAAGNAFHGTGTVGGSGGGGGGYAILVLGSGTAPTVRAAGGAAGLASGGGAGSAGGAGKTITFRMN